MLRWSIFHHPVLALRDFGILYLKILEIKKAQLLSCAFFGGYYIWFMYYLISSKVVHCLMSPVLKPFLNQYILCSDVPCVKESGTICPCILL